jgi:hypothetical protein
MSTYHIVIYVLSYSVSRYIADKWGKKPNHFLVLSPNNIGNLCDLILPGLDQEGYP